ncbi:MAG: NADH oxidase [Actinomycetota bacterium]|nr:NADH oxidase [Actinomycetota bacterium]
MSSENYPEKTLELISTLSVDGSVTVIMREAAIPKPGPTEVVVRVEAAPINPSDIGTLFAHGEVTEAQSIDAEGMPGVRIPVSEAAQRAQLARVGAAMPVGNEGGGTVIAAGSSTSAQAAVGRVVGFFSRNAYAQYRTIDISQCTVMGEGVTAEQAAAANVNPLTALGMVETMRYEGHAALVHTVGASNLGLMLGRVCQADGVDLVNIVRSPEQSARLRSQGEQWVCDSSGAGFESDLLAAIEATGATIAFDAIGGGSMADTLLAVMELSLSSQALEYRPYGSETRKQIYVYGGLDPAATVLTRRYGMQWAVGGWLLAHFLRKIGSEAEAGLRRRIASEITTTFASEYGLRLSLADVVDPVHVKQFARTATGGKAIVRLL